MIRHESRNPPVTSVSRPHTGPGTKFVVLGAALVISLNLMALYKGNYLNQVIATMMLLLALYPFWRFLKRREGQAPLVPIFAGVYWIHFGLQVFIPLDANRIYNDVAPEHVTSGLLLATAGLALFLFAFHAISLRSWLRPLPQISDEWSEGRAKLVALVLALGGLFVFALDQMSLIPTTKTIDTIAFFMNLLSILGTAVFFLLHLRGRLVPLEGWLLWVVLIPLQIAILWGLGGAAPAARFVMVLLIVFVAEKRTLAPFGGGALVLML